MSLPFRRRIRPAVLLLAVLGASGALAVPSASAATLPAGPFAGRALYVAPTSAASAVTGSARADDVASRLAGVPQAIWLVGGSPAAAASTVSAAVAAAAPAGAVTQFVVYDIPGRDCTGGASAGGAATAADYQSYVAAIAHAMHGGHAMVVLEPDALAGLDCLSAAAQTTRLSLLKWAVDRLAAVPGVLVYLDAGHAHWQPATTMAARLSKAGLADARGFALNVSSFDPVSSEIAYGQAISARDGWKRFVIDTSRDGTSPVVAGWCNPAGASFGPAPGTPAGYAGVDALLWIKHPGESDGACGTSTAPAGRFDPQLAVALATQSGW